jgi:hypothetical protein
MEYNVRGMYVSEGFICMHLLTYICQRNYNMRETLYITYNEIHIQ